jgi:hypothetical protein
LQSYKETTGDFSRAAVLLIALSVFGSALCGLGYSYAVSTSGEAAHKALQNVAEMHDRSSRLHAVINHVMVMAANIDEHQARAAVARENFGEAPDKITPDLFPQAQSKAFDSIVNNKKEKFLRADLADPKLGTDGDLWFPEKLKAKPLAKKNWWESLARWDLASQRSLAWHAKAQILLGILTVLAMAIYLFARAHSLEEGCCCATAWRCWLMPSYVFSSCWGLPCRNPISMTWPVRPRQPKLLRRPCRNIKAPIPAKSIRRSFET